jgi:hypothetical protein
MGGDTAHYEGVSPGFYKGVSTIPVSVHSSHAASSPTNSSSTPR